MMYLSEEIYPSVMAKTHVEVSNQELKFILRSYLKHSNNWMAIMNDIRQQIDRLRPVAMNELGIHKPNRQREPPTMGKHFYQLRDADTVLSIIERIACLGSIIYSDKWRPYHSFHQRLQLDHGTVNHSLNFVDP